MKANPQLQMQMRMQEQMRKKMKRKKRRNRFIIGFILVVFGFCIFYVFSGADLRRKTGQLSLSAESSSSSSYVSSWTLNKSLHSSSTSSIRNDGALESFTFPSFGMVVRTNKKTNSITKVYRGVSKIQIKNFTQELKSSQYTVVSETDTGINYSGQFRNLDKKLYVSVSWQEGYSTTIRVTTW